MPPCTKQHQEKQAENKLISHLNNVGRNLMCAAKALLVHIRLELLRRCVRLPLWGRLPAVLNMHRLNHSLNATREVSTCHVWVVMMCWAMLLNDSAVVDKVHDGTSCKH